jgi:hypothetical protein
MIEAPDAITTCGIFASAEIAAAASVTGVTLYPASIATLLIDDQFLGNAFSLVGKPGVVAHDQLDCSARNLDTVLRDEQPDRSKHLLAVHGKWPCHRGRESDLDSFLRLRRCSPDGTQNTCRDERFQKRSSGVHGAVLA